MQSRSDQSFNYKAQKIIEDSGNNWENVSVIHSNNYLLSNNRIQNKTSFKKRLGFKIFDEQIDPYFFGSFRTKKYFFFIESENIFNNYQSFSLEHSPLKNMIMSGFGYYNHWVTIAINKGNQNWGAGNDISLALNKNGQSFDYFMLASNYGSLRVNYIHGFLETLNSGINRYINARGVEWTNKKNLIIGLSESIIYSGINRSIDFGYLNPISSHLEVELNNRLNVYGDLHSNAVWQLHCDLFKNKQRFSLNYLFDEFVIDPDIEVGKEHGRGFSLKYLQSLNFKKPDILNLYISYIAVGTPTFRHANGSNNFVKNGRAIGWPGGSDSREAKLGFDYLKKENKILHFSICYYQLGSENIIYRPYERYEDYMKGTFPSDPFKQFIILNAKVMMAFRENLYFDFEFAKNYPMKSYDRSDSKYYTNFQVGLVYSSN